MNPKRWATFIAAAVVVVTAVVVTAQTVYINEQLQARAEEGDAKAQIEVGYQIEILDSPVEAVQWYRLAAEQGYAEGQYRLGMMYEDGNGGLLQDDAEAHRLYKLAADQGFTSAQTSLGHMYSSGRGVPRDVVEAMRLYLVAAENGDVYALEHLALIYVFGAEPFIEINLVEAYKWEILASTRMTIMLSENGLSDVLKIDSVGARRDFIGASLNAREREEGQRLAREWDEAHPRD